MKTVPLIEEFSSVQKNAREVQTPNDTRLNINQLKRSSIDKAKSTEPTMKQSLRKVTEEWFEDTSFHGNFSQIASLFK